MVEYNKLSQWKMALKQCRRVWYSVTEKPIRQQGMYFIFAGFFFWNTDGEES